MTIILYMAIYCCKNNDTNRLCLHNYFTRQYRFILNTLFAERILTETREEIGEKQSPSSISPLTERPKDGSNASSRPLN